MAMLCIVEQSDFTSWDISVPHPILEHNKQKHINFSFPVAVHPPIPTKLWRWRLSIPFSHM